MNTEYIKFLQAFSKNGVVSEKEFEKIIKLFPNTKIDWEKVIENVSYCYSEDYTDSDEIIKSIILSIIDTEYLYIYDYYSEDNSVSLEIIDDLSKEKLSEEIYKLESIGFTINDKEDLFKGLKEKKEYNDYLSDIQTKINKLSLEQLQKLEKVIDNGLN